MKVCVIQPEFSTDMSRCDELFERSLALLDSCDNSMDIIVMPESGDNPCYTTSKAQSEEWVEKYNKRYLDKLSETAKRCNALVFGNARKFTPKGLRNTTFAFDRNGQPIGEYYKQHLVPSEVSVMELDNSYTLEHSEPTVLEAEGIRFAFLICYDCYFYENFPNIARQNVDVIIACCHQRSDTHNASDIMARFLAYNTNAYVLRACTSLGENSPTGGASMIVTPDGRVLEAMGSRVGLACAEIDINQKYYKPAGFGNPDAAHYEYIEKGRRPWKYRPAGSAITTPDAWTAFPRVCAHRGFSTVAPENSMPAFGAAVAMGADEIEFDLWYTKDGEIVSLHDSTLERVSNGEGLVYEHTLEELEALDFGSKFSERFKGLGIVRFEDILKKFACHVIMNIHVKTLDDNYSEELIKKIVSLVRKYDCEKYVYFMISHDGVLKKFKSIAPDIGTCVGYLPDHPKDMVDRALEVGAERIQLFKPYFDRALVEKAHRNGIRCNVFWSDDIEETKQFLDMGIDTILTNDYCIVSQAVNAYKEGEIK